MPVMRHILWHTIGDKRHKGEEKAKKRHHAKQIMRVELM